MVSSGKGPCVEGERGAGDAPGVNQGPRRALSILPKSVWIKVFKNLKDDHRAIKSLAETCRSFHRILEDMEPPSRWELRMQEVIRIIESWRYMTGSWLRKMKRITVESEEGLEKAQRDLEGIMWTRRLIREISIRIPYGRTGDESTDFLVKSLSLLPLLPKSLTRVELDLTYWYPLETYQEAYDILGMILKLVPGIKKVRTSAYLLSAVTPEEEQERVASFQEHVNSKPLPAGDKLESLEIEGLSVPAAWVQEIGAKYGGTLKRLRINQIFWKGAQQEISGVSPVTFCKLQVLEVCLRFGNPAPALLIKAPELQSLILRILDKPPGIQGTPGYLEQVFQVLDNFEDKLTGLCLDLDIPKTLDFSEVIQRYLHKRYSGLKYLNLERWGYRVPLAYFATLFPNLEKISVSALIEERLYADKRLQLDPDLSLIEQCSLEESQLWRKLPKLAKVTTFHPFGPKWGTVRALKVSTYFRPEEMGGPPKKSRRSGEITRKWVMGLEILILVIGCLIALLAWQ